MCMRDACRSSKALELINSIHCVAEENSVRRRRARRCVRVRLARYHRLKAHRVRRRSPPAARTAADAQSSTRGGTTSLCVEKHASLLLRSCVADLRSRLATVVSAASPCARSTIADTVQTAALVRVLAGRHVVVARRARRNDGALASSKRRPPDAALICVRLCQACVSALLVRLEEIRGIIIDCISCLRSCIRVARSLCCLRNALP